MFKPIDLDCLGDTVEEVKESARVLGIYFVYADSVAQVAFHRDIGDHETARVHQLSADLAYKRLPEWAKW